MSSEEVPDLSSNTPETKEQIKKIEESIVQKINKYNDEIKLSETEEAKVHKLQSKAYLLSEKYRKLRGEPEALSEIESELGVLETEINSALTSLAESKHVALVTLQSLYKEHVEYLSNVAKGLKSKNDELEKKLNTEVEPVQPNIREAAAAALNTPTVVPVPVPQESVSSVQSAPAKVGKRGKRGDNIKS